VSLMIGVNDQYQGLSLAEFERGLAGLLARAVALAGGEAGRVLVVSIPDYGVTPFAARSGLDPAATAAEIDRFNAAARAATERLGARWVDVTAASRRAAGDRGLLAADGLHPSGRLHAEWAALALPAALGATGALPTGRRIPAAELKPGLARSAGVRTLDAAATPDFPRACSPPSQGRGAARRLRRPLG
jgi:hypothetical protein